MPGYLLSKPHVMQALARAISGAGSDEHLDRLIDLLGTLAAHDTVTVTRYSTTQRPEFVTHRNFPDEMVQRYLDHYYVYDPFFGYWRDHRQPAVVWLGRLAGPKERRGLYVQEFLRQSVIADEVGVLLDDGEGWCLGIFLERSGKRFARREIDRIEAWFPLFSALHDLDFRTRTPHPTRAGQTSSLTHAAEPGLPRALWPDLSVRERQLVELVIAGHPSSTIAARLGITIGTVKNHRRRIYDKLDITTERELFLQYFQFMSART